MSNVFYDMLEIRHGVPEGSILDPSLFLVYVNDITTIHDSPELYVYADDINAFFKAQSEGTLETMANRYQFAYLDG